MCEMLVGADAVVGICGNSLLITSLSQRHLSRARMGKEV